MVCVVVVIVGIRRVLCTYNSSLNLLKLRGNHWLHHVCHHTVSRSISEHQRQITEQCQTTNSCAPGSGIKRGPDASCNQRPAQDRERPRQPDQHEAHRSRESEKTGDRGHHKMNENDAKPHAKSNMLIPSCVNTKSKPTCKLCAHAYNIIQSMFTC